ncbi:MAG: VCBS repeat-containing protein [Deltaproteobacteria bacterium]|nr:VCBS repeat-containing protein [Deltaproteobacteria bacterium]
MAEKSGISEQIISTPKGGGALSGIGEKFSPDLFTGTGNFTVPISLPSGRNGFQPQLNLVYSTGNGNGPFGLGWSLSIPGVSRKTAKGIPVYDDAKDTFILSGAEDLVPVVESEAQTQYRPRTEGIFARIIHHRDSENDYWEVRSKDGLVSLYGTPHAAGDDPAAVADPSDRTKVFVWKLTKTVDPFGNRIEYAYGRDAGEDTEHLWDQLYLQQIRYVDYTDANGDEQFLVSVDFNYGEPDELRPDPFSHYRAGFEIRTRKRCTSIEIATHAGEQRLVRTYRLIYLDQRADLEDLEQLLPLNGVSLLSQVKVIGHDGDLTETLPPLEFGYTNFTPEGRDFLSLAGMELPAHSLASPDLELVDLFGNGLPDLVEMNAAVRYWRNLGNGCFDLPRQMQETPAGLSLADPGVQFIDADGDGRADLLVTREGIAGYYPLSFGGCWDKRSFQRYDLAPSFNLEDPEVRLVDLDGDGVTDALRSGSRLECFFNDPKEGWNHTRVVERRAIEAFPNISFSDPHVQLADMSGDGLQDIVFVHDGNVEYWPNLGYGWWGRRIHMKNSPRLPYGYDPRRILIGDVDGDGLADIVYVEDTQVTLWINQGGNRWSEPIEIHGTPPVSDMDAVRLADMLGTGVKGVLWSSDVNVLGRENYFFLDFTGGINPYLLNAMENHMGATTRVEYAPSTKFYLEDQQQPETRWNTTLPFPVQVVARVEVIDQLSGGKLTTEYTYHHGYWDGAEGEFRGFGRVDQRDTEVFEQYHAPGLHPDSMFEEVEQQMFSPPLETRTWFHQGPIGDEFGDWHEADFSGEFFPDDPNLLSRPKEMTEFLKNLDRQVRRDALRALRGSILRTELYALDGTDRQDRPYTVTENLYGVREESPPGADEEDRYHIFFSYALAQRTTQWERGDDPMTQFSFTEDYDEYGQPQTQTQIACPRNWRTVDDVPNKPYLATRSKTIYAQPMDPEQYIVDRVARVTSYEIQNSGEGTIFDLKHINDNSPDLKVIGQSVNYYDGEAFIGLPFGQVGAYGALVRSETLILTDEILQEAYQSGDANSDLSQIPPYLVIGDSVPWSDDYPQGFRNELPPLAGYVYHDGADEVHAPGYYVVAVQNSFDFHDNSDGNCRGLVKINRDPLGSETSIDYDIYDFLPVTVTDPVGLTIQAMYDYRLFQPKEVTDPNGNRTAFGYTSLGLIKYTAIMGKPDEAVGDTEEVPGTLLEYDLLAFYERQEPISVRTLKRAHHINDSDVPLPERDETIETVEYSDGLGRLLQTRTQAEDVIFDDPDLDGPLFGTAGLPANQDSPATDAVAHERGESEPPNVLVSGWQVYNNKGLVVEKYDPFFSRGWDFAQPQDYQCGQKATIYFDPRGQAIRTVNPDGSEQGVIYGVPENLEQPEDFAPTPWEVYTYDANDNGGRTHPEQAAGYQDHWNTPSSAVIDALGRTIETVVRNGADAGDWYTTRSTYDIRGNLLTVTDELGRLAFRYFYDLTPSGEDEEEGAQVLRIEQLDAGIRRMVFDAMGNEIERRDSKETLILQNYDILHRPINLWARDRTGEGITLREHLVYGDNLSQEMPSEEIANNNLLGKPYQHYDEAGLVTFESYDFKGNVLHKKRQVISDEAIFSVFDPQPEDWNIPAFRIDWQPTEGVTLADHAATLVDSTVYQTSIAYDALNRTKTMLYPQDVEGSRKQFTPDYNSAGALESVELDDTTYVEHIAYNAKGQRILIAYGNGIMTRYTYDQQTFRLLRMRTEHYTKPSVHTYHPTGTPLQDFAYTYDLVGNITAIYDRTKDCGVPVTPNQLDRAFTYDPIYRLISATGREYDVPPGQTPWDTRFRCADITKARHYTEEYQYDPAGNMLQLQHMTANGGSFNRHITLASNSNRLANVSMCQTVYNYAYDSNGNLIQETTSRHFEWDHSNRLRVYRTQMEDAEPSIHAHYLYDSGGQRLKKIVRHQGGKVTVTVYIDGIFEHHVVKENEIQENNTIHVMDDQKRVAIVRVGGPLDDDTTPAVKYHLGDHLGSSNVVIDEAAEWVNREEYTPYGETSFGGYAKKRYCHSGKEQDEESGLYYYGARYYGTWLARWISCDPAGMVDGLNLFLYVLANPLRFLDPIGLQTKIEIGVTSEEGEFWRENIIPVLKPYTETMWGINFEQPLAREIGMLEGAVSTLTFGIVEIGPVYPGSIAEEVGRQVGSYLVMLSCTKKRSSIPRRQPLPKVAKPAAPMPLVPKPAISPKPVITKPVVPKPTLIGSALRKSYIAEVEALKEQLLTMEVAGIPRENIAKLLHAQRRALGVKYKNLTPPKKLEEIYQRNLRKYGDQLGPSIEWLRAKGKTWNQIIESATETGGKDLGL